MNLHSLSFLSTKSLYLFDIISDILFLLQGSTTQKETKKESVKSLDGKISSKSATESSQARLKREKAECPLYYALTDDYIGKLLLNLYVVYLMSCR